MRNPSEEEQRQLVRQWEETDKKLTAIRLAALRDMPYNWEDVVELLQMGDNYDGPPRLTSGLVELQRIFKKHHPKQDRRSVTHDTS